MSTLGIKFYHIYVEGEAIHSNHRSISFPLILNPGSFHLWRTYEACLSNIHFFLGSFDFTMNREGNSLPKDF